MARKFKSVISGPRSVNRFLIPNVVEDSTPPLPTKDLRATKNAAQEVILGVKSGGGGGGDNPAGPGSTANKGNREFGPGGPGSPGSGVIAPGTGATPEGFSVNIPLSAIAVGALRFTPAAPFAFAASLVHLGATSLLRDVGIRGPALNLSIDRGLTYTPGSLGKTSQPVKTSSSSGTGGPAPPITAPPITAKRHGQEEEDLLVTDAALAAARRDFNITWAAIGIREAKALAQDSILGKQTGRIANWQKAANAAAAIKADEGTSADNTDTNRPPTKLEPRLTDFEGSPEMGGRRDDESSYQGTSAGYGGSSESRGFDEN
jgi:hypothetical protein